MTWTLQDTYHGPSAEDENKMVARATIISDLPDTRIVIQAPTTVDRDVLVEEILEKMNS